MEGIAYNAARYARRGLRLGCGAAAGVKALDVCDWRLPDRTGRVLLGLHGANPVGSEGWRAWLVEDRRARPADEAAFRIDFPAWLDRLSARKRLIAERLAGGVHR